MFARTPDIQAVVPDSSYANFDNLVHSEFTPLTGLPEFFLPGMMMAGQMLWNIDTDQFWHPDDYVRRVVTFLSGN